MIVCTFIGNLAFAYMIGKMTAMAARVDAAGQMYQVKMDEVVSAARFARGASVPAHVRSLPIMNGVAWWRAVQNEFMRHHMLPRKLRTRIRAFYETFWAHGVYFNEKVILSELSFSLRRDVDFYLKREIITSVPFFKDADPNFVAELISRLDLKHCQADETLIEAGEIGCVERALPAFAPARQAGRLAHPLRRPGTLHCVAGARCSLSSRVRWL